MRVNPPRKSLTRSRESRYAHWFAHGHPNVDADERVRRFRHQRQSPGQTESRLYTPK
jgi:hypothetical protein